MASISEVKGIGPATAKALAAKGFKTAEKLAKAGTADVIVVSGIGDARANALIAAAQALIAAAGAPKAPAKASPAKEKSKGKKDKKAKKSKKKK